MRFRTRHCPANFRSVHCFCIHMLAHMLLQVDNTDAEGRLTLADALVYACNQGVDKVTI